MHPPGASNDPEIAIELDRIGAPIAICTRSGTIAGATPQARRLLSQFGILTRGAPELLPPDLWRSLVAVPHGEAIEWQPASAGSDACLGCTAYELGDRHLFLLMRELSEKRLALSRNLHKQRLEITGRLVAMIAHDLRAPLASIVFNADILFTRARPLLDDSFGDAIDELRTAAQRLQWTIDGLLDFARLGPPVSMDVSLRSVLERVSSLVRPAYRDGSHQMSVHLAPDATWVKANPLVLEQILVNLLMNAAEASDRAIRVDVASEAVVGPAEIESPSPLIRVLVRDDGPGVSDELRGRIFEPFFTTKPHGSGLGLTSAREAARDLGGDLLLATTPGVGAVFSLLLPAATPPKSATERP